MFAALSDADLLSIGTPQELLEQIRSIHTEFELDAVQGLLPVEAYEGLFLIAAGDSVSDVLIARETRVDRPIDTEDFATAIETAESQSRFVVVADEETMAAMLNSPLSQWRVFLHPTQRKLAQGDRGGPVRVLGGAGFVAPSEKITLALIGCGTQGLRELPSLFALPEVQIVAVCDPVKDGHDYLDWSRDGHRAAIAEMLRQPDWRRGQPGIPGGREVAREVVETVYARQRS